MVHNLFKKKKKAAMQSPCMVCSPSGDCPFFFFVSVTLKSALHPEKNSGSSNLFEKLIFVFFLF
jgi:hypothetical protein